MASCWPSQRLFHRLDLLPLPLVPTPLPAYFPMPLPLGFLLNNCSPFKTELKRAPF